MSGLHKLRQTYPAPLNLFADHDFKIFFETHALGLFRYARSRVYDRDDAEDLCSEAWLRFFEGYHQPGSIRSEPERVIFGILRNLLSDYYRNKKQIKTAILILEEASAAGVERASSVESAVMLREFEEHVIACLFALKDDLKLAWLLKFDPLRIDWISILSGQSGDVIQALHRQTATREIFIDEARAAALMRKSVWSYRRKYEKAQKIMNDLMRKNNWGDLLERF